MFHSTQSLGTSWAEAGNLFMSPIGEDPSKAYGRHKYGHIQWRSAAKVAARRYDRDSGSKGTDREEQIVQHHMCEKMLRVFPLAQNRYAVCWLCQSWGITGRSATCWL